MVWLGGGEALEAISAGNCLSLSGVGRAGGGRGHTRERRVDEDVEGRFRELLDVVLGG